LILSIKIIDKINKRSEFLTMNASDQGTREPQRARYQAIPRTLIFVTSAHPETGAQEILLLKGAPTKRLWANLYNGLGGHVEPDEDVLTAARRELDEEAGLQPEQLNLRGVINIHTGSDEAGLRPGVLVFVFHAHSEQRTVRATPEGMPEWLPVAKLADYPLVDDLYTVIPRVLAGGFFYGHYAPDAEGHMVYHFVE
jgi:8-oxo-dGTP diphosphatase